MSDASVHDPVENMPQMKEALQRVGFLARERPVDDELDSETWTALYLFAESRGIDWPLDDFEAEDGVIPPAVSAALLDPMAMMSFSSIIDEDGELVFDDDDPPGPSFNIDLDEVEVFDYRNDHELNEKKCRRKPRDLEKVDSIMLHQTGIKFGVGKRAMDKYGKRNALHRRFWNVACHAAALMNGDVLLIHPWERYVLHGHRGNRSSIGIEIEGLYAGIAGDPKTVSGKQAVHLDLRTIAAARKAVEVCVEQGRAAGCPITKITAHRQYHGSRISDPGEEIWREVALWAVDTLGLRPDYDLAARNKKDPRKSGRKIPRQWDPKGTVDYRGRAL
jgi:hypothetical protein